jgi:transposase
LYDHVSRLREGLLSGQYDVNSDDNIDKFLIVEKSDKFKNGIRVTIREDVIEDVLRNTGWMVAIGNHLKSSKEVLELYREKDVIQKLFNRVKGVINSKRLRLASGDIEENKLLIGFIATILISHIHKVMTDKGLYNKYSLFEVFKILEHIGGIYSKGKRMRYKLTDSQKEIFAAFDCPLPKEIYPQKGIFLKGRHPKKA